MKLAVIANPKKYSVKEPFTETLNWADKNNVKVYFNDDLQELYDGNNHTSAELVATEKTAIDKADIVVALGGDGTMLYTARLMKNISKPILGVNGMGTCITR